MPIWPFLNSLHHFLMWCTLRILHHAFLLIGGESWSKISVSPLNWIKLWISLWDQVPSVVATAHHCIAWTAFEWLLYCVLHVTPNTSVNSYHKTKCLISIKVRRWRTLPIEHALYIDTYKPIVLSLCGLAELSELSFYLFCVRYDIWW
jgi:hypothetical protein